MITTHQKQLCLKSCALFGPLETDSLGVLAEAMEVERFRDGEEVCVYGEQADCVYVILEGTLAVFIPGSEKAIRQMEAGDVFGEYGMFTGRRTTTIVAVGGATLLSMEYPRFKAFLSQYPDAMYLLLGIAVDRLGAAEAKLYSR
jgi:CRP-like cAMP-binding protein